MLQRVGQELVLYDLRFNRAIHLNASLMAVWDCCDGRTSIDEIPSLVASKIGRPVNSDFVELALDELRQRSLLEGIEPAASTPQEITRREWLKKACAVSLVALPVLSSITVPSPTAAMSTACLNTDGQGNELNGCLCTAANDCASDCCGFAADGMSLVCVPENSMPNGSPCRDDCNCVSDCCGPAGIGCITPGTLMAGASCRQNCNCASGNCTGSPKVCV